MVQLDLFTKQKKNHRCRNKHGQQSREGSRGLNWKIGTDIYTWL